jgi:hypothetical protein
LQERNPVLRRGDADTPAQQYNDGLQNITGELAPARYVPKYAIRAAVRSTPVFQTQSDRADLPDPSRNS